MATIATSSNNFSASGAKIRATGAVSWLEKRQMDVERLFPVTQKKNPEPEWPGF
ncbi:MAG: hypothetical protein M0Q95_04545 [Porticoccaceae bacterium]|nr:hypothetical protein [Porticoccaceae bacterium]